MSLGRIEWCRTGNLQRAIDFLGFCPFPTPMQMWQSLFREKCTILHIVRCGCEYHSKKNKPTTLQKVGNLSIMLHLWPKQKGGSRHVFQSGRGRASTFQANGSDKHVIQSDCLLKMLCQSWGPTDLLRELPAATRHPLPPKRSRTRSWTVEVQLSGNRPAVKGVYMTHCADIAHTNPCAVFLLQKLTRLGVLSLCVSLSLSLSICLSIYLSTFCFFLSHQFVQGTVWTDSWGSTWLSTGVSSKPRLPRVDVHMCTSQGPLCSCWNDMVTCHVPSTILTSVYICQGEVQFLSFFAHRYEQGTRTSESLDVAWIASQTPRGKQRGDRCAI